MRKADNIEILVTQAKQIRKECIAMIREGWSKHDTHIKFKRGMVRGIMLAARLIKGFQTHAKTKNIARASRMVAA